MIGDILQPTHLLFILIVALLVLGPKRLPEVGRTLGKGLRDFRHALAGEDVQAVRDSLRNPIVLDEPDPQVVPTGAMQATAPESMARAPMQSESAAPTPPIPTGSAYPVATTPQVQVVGPTAIPPEAVQPAVTFSAAATAVAERPTPDQPDATASN